MFQVFKNAWSIKDLRSKILYTLLMLLVVRLCTYIPTPFVDTSVVKQIVQGSSWGIIDVVTGGAMENYTFMAMGISPYITASIILQLLGVVIPKLEQLSKEGPEGRKKINQYTRYLAIGLAFVQAVGIIYSFGPTAIVSSMRNKLWLAYIVIGVVLTGGAAMAMWIGERITEKGIGNGISMLIFIGIVAKLPATVAAYVQNWIQSPELGWFLIPIIAFIAGLIVLIVFVDLGERRVPIQYAKRVTGRKVYGGQSTYMPIKPNSAGVLPLIFAMSFLTFPSILITIFQWSDTGFGLFYDKWLGAGSWGYAIASVIFIIFFSYFYSSITFNPEEVANDIQKYGGFIQGIRPGKPTAEYLKRINSRLILFQGLFLSVIAVLPMIVSALVGNIQEYGAPILKLALTFGSTGLLILTSVSIEVAKQLEAQMVMNHYKGFLD